MELKLIIVSPKYQLNVGYIARVAKNFGIDKLYFVKPRANIHGKKAIMYSKHAHDLLDSAFIKNTLEEFANECDVLVGTSGIFRSNPRLGQVYTPENAYKKILDESKRYKKNMIVGLVIGRDDKGLTAKELELCDILVHINANLEYPVLNISHSIAILLYEANRFNYKKSSLNLEKPGIEEQKMLLSLFDDSIRNKRIRDKKSVSRIFRKMLRRSQLDRHELHAMISAFKE